LFGRFILEVTERLQWLETATRAHNGARRWQRANNTHDNDADDDAAAGLTELEIASESKVAAAAAATAAAAAAAAAAVAAAPPPPPPAATAAAADPTAVPKGTKVSKPTRQLDPSDASSPAAASATAPSATARRPEEAAAALPDAERLRKLSAAKLRQVADRLLGGSISFPFLGGSRSLFRPFSFSLSHSLSTFSPFVFFFIEKKSSLLTAQLSCGLSKCPLSQKTPIRCRGSFRAGSQNNLPLLLRDLVLLQAIGLAGGAHDDCFGKQELLARALELQRSDRRRAAQPARATTPARADAAAAARDARVAIGAGGEVIGAGGEVPGEGGPAGASAARGPVFSEEVRARVRS
jgi:hypothetical protein